MNPITANNMEQELKKLSEEWAAAELRGDTAFLGRTLADDFVGIGPRGFMLTKEDWLQRITSGALKYDGFDWDEVQVRAYGDAAIVIGRQAQKARYQDRPIEGEFRTTLVFVRQQGGWLLAGLQLSPIAGPIAGMPPMPPASEDSSSGRR
jgi:ketosteroid isomerase-like protein